MENFGRDRTAVPASSQRGQRGFSTVEVMTAAGLLSVLALGFAELINNQPVSLKSNRMVATRDELKNTVTKYASDPKALHNSEAFNILLQDCVSNVAGNCGDASHTPRETVSFVSFDLYPVTRA